MPLAGTGDLRERLLVALRRLRPFDRVLVVDDDERYAAHAALEPVLFPRANVLLELAAFNDGPGSLLVEADLPRKLHQDIRRAGISALCVIGVEQRALQLERASLESRPVQHPVRIEGVPHVFPRREGKADLGTALADHGLHLRDLFGCAAILACYVRRDLGAFGPHVRVELERLDPYLRVHVAAQARESLVHRSEPDRAPGARDVGDEGNVERIAFHRQMVTVVAPTW